MDLSEFLLARIAEDEAVAREAASYGDRWYKPRDRDNVSVDVEPFDSGTALCRAANYRVRALPHIAVHDPARVLAECAAKRRARDFQIADELDRILAQPYASHPDFRPEWSALADA